MTEQNALILIVDDDEPMVELLSRLMKGEGFKTLHARDGATGLKMVSSESPDLLLLDITTPPWMGWRCSRAKEIDQIFRSSC
jgi:DNA-binding response OmpR family regulator